MPSSSATSAMLGRVVLVLCFTSVISDGEHVTKKFCKDVDTSQCRVHNILVEPCPQGPHFCIMKTNKQYGLTLDMTPFFSTQKLKLAISADVDNDDNFATVVKTPQDACNGILQCPLEAEQRRIFNFDFSLSKTASGKFPVKVKLWNEDDESQACCATFVVKVK